MTSRQGLPQQRRDLLEILEDRHGARATLVTSQLPSEQWHDAIGNATLADAILDRLVHNAYKFTLIRRIAAQTGGEVDSNEVQAVTRSSNKKQ